jgi:hypothetical protein
MKKLLLAACVLLPVTARADGPDVFGGYAFSRREGDSYHGVRAGLDFGLTRRFGFEVAASGQRMWSHGSHYTDTGLMVGPRFHGTGRNAPFLALSAGFVHTSQHIDGGDFSFDDAYTEPIVALDAGVDLAVGERWAVRVQAGVQFTDDLAVHGDFGEDEWQANPRGSLAIVWRPGR